MLGAPSDRGNSVASPTRAATRTCLSNGKYWGSVITRPSGSGGTSPDLKDLAGPARFNFGKVSASATLTPTCELSFGYAASAKGLDGNPIDMTTAECSWTFTGGSVSSACSGSHAAAAAGSYTGTVKVKDPVSGCESESASDDVLVCSPLGVTADLNAVCTPEFTYAATPSGGCGAVTYDWTFSGGTPSSSTGASGTVGVSVTGQSYTGTVVVTDTRTDGPVCTAQASDSATPFSPLAVYLTPAAQSLACPMTTDEVSWTATPSGGNGDYSFAWTPASCSGATCTINPADTAFCDAGSVQVTLSDSSRVCASVTSEEETYDKKTTITVSNN